MDHKNNSYPHFVDGKGDVLGMVAYGIYTNEKLGYVKNLNTENQLESDKIEEFKKIQRTPEQLKRFKDQASELLKSIYTRATDEKHKELTDKEKSLNAQVKLLAKRESELNEKNIKLKAKERSLKARDKYCLVKNKHYYLHGVLQSMVGSFLFLLITALIYFWLVNPDAFDLLKNIVKNP